MKGPKPPEKPISGSNLTEDKGRDEILVGGRVLKKAHILKHSYYYELV